MHFKLFRFVLRSASGRSDGLSASRRDCSTSDRNRIRKLGSFLGVQTRPPRRSDKSFFLVNGYKKQMRITLDRWLEGDFCNYIQNIPCVEIIETAQHKRMLIVTVGLWLKLPIGIFWSSKYWVQWTDLVELSLLFDYKGHIFPPKNPSALIPVKSRWVRWSWWLVDVGIWLMTSVRWKTSWWPMVRGSSHPMMLNATNYVRTLVRRNDLYYTADCIQ